VANERPPSATVLPQELVRRVLAMPRERAVALDRKIKCKAPLVSLPLILPPPEGQLGHPKGCERVAKSLQVRQQLPHLNQPRWVVEGIKQLIVFLRLNCRPECQRTHLVAAGAAVGSTAVVPSGMAAVLPRMIRRRQQWTR